MIHDKKHSIDELVRELKELKSQLFEANSMIDAIREGSVDALVLHKNGTPSIYSLETADYTYRILIEKFGEGALTISETGLILYCNEAFAYLINKPRNKIIGTYFNSYVESVGSFQELKNGLETGQSKGEILLNVEGNKLPIHISLSDLQPQVKAIGIIVTDLSEKKKHEDAILQYQQKLEAKVNELNLANRKLEQFVHVISHDIKEPIRKIVAYSSHLNYTRNQLGQSELKDLNVITTSATRLNSLVDDLVKYAFSTNDTEFSKIDLQQTLQEVSEDMELLIKEGGATIKFSKLPVINGSQVQMRQLFTNLINNAIKYRKQHVNPEISIIAEITDCVDINFPNKKFHKISVHDNGIGMDTSQLSKIFTIFQRLHMPHEYSGNGIGLAICKRIVENHYGNIEAESSLNDGSTFNVYFPVE